jgi:hypothetical protein
MRRKHAFTANPQSFKRPLLPANERQASNAPRLTPIIDMAAGKIAEEAI